MSAIAENDLVDMEKKLNQYVENGLVFSSDELSEERVISVRPEPSRIKPLKKISDFSGVFIAVDCSTRTLKRANNWGIYLMRTTSVLVKERKVDWNYEERLFTAMGDAKARRNMLTDYRMELESELALKLLKSGSVILDRGETVNYLLLDGGAYFGGKRKFRLSLYDMCEKLGIFLLALSKNSPILHDEKGRDLLANIGLLSPYSLWTYYPIREADRSKQLFGAVSLVKLCEGSPRIFRCDIMEYLKDHEAQDMLSPLTAVAEDARCLGYPVPLYLAHEFSGPSDTTLFHYYDVVEDRLSEAGLSKTLCLEVQSSCFADEIHGIKYPFRREVVGDYV
jgi:hypothetical protein